MFIADNILFLLDSSESESGKKQMGATGATLKIAGLSNLLKMFWQFLVILKVITEFCLIETSSGLYISLWHAQFWN